MHEQKATVLVVKKINPKVSIPNVRIITAKLQASIAMIRIQLVHTFLAIVYFLISIKYPKFLATVRAPITAPLYLWPPPKKWC